jgi:hypothetical protein
MSSKSTDKHPPIEEQRRAYSNAQSWLGALCQRRLAWYDDQGVARVNESVAARFSLGLHDEKIFIAMRDEEALWAEGMPWEYAAIYRGKKDLYIVSSPVETESGLSDPFGLSFQLRSISESASLAAYDSMQMRRFARGIDNFQRIMVARLPFATMPIIVLEENQSVFDANIRPKSKLNSRGSK